jgi:hypothetical protein
MHNTRSGGLDRHSDQGGSKVATERTWALSGLAGFPPNFLGVVEDAVVTATHERSLR